MSEYFIPAIAVVALSANVVATVLLLQDKVVNAEQRQNQLLLIWLLPVIGATLCIAVNRLRPRNPFRSRTNIQATTDGTSVSSEDFRELRELLLPFARSAIQDDGFLLPVAAGVTRAGRTFKFASGAIAPSIPIETAKHLDDLIWAMRESVKRAEVRAVAYAVDVTTLPAGPKGLTDAIVVSFESLEALPMSAIVRYGKPSTGLIQFDEPVVGTTDPATARVFNQPVK